MARRTGKRDVWRIYCRTRGYYGGFVKKPAGSALNPGTGLSCNRMIEIRNIQKKFGERVILHDITAVMEAGKCNLIIGTSGSGKTVLTKCMVGLFEPDQGRNPVRWCGYDHHGRRPAKMLRQQIGMLFQGTALFDSMTVENRMFFSRWICSPNGQFG
jgi:ABC-type transporter Mla maintaining outer membrane lipid asymmetry ATPase subunit MlaF